MAACMVLEQSLRVLNPDLQVYRFKKKKKAFDLEWAFETSEQREPPSSRPWKLGLARKLTSTRIAGVPLPQPMFRGLYPRERSAHLRGKRKNQAGNLGSLVCPEGANNCEYYSLPRTSAEMRLGGLGQ